MKSCRAIAFCSLLVLLIGSIALMALVSHLHRPHLSVVVSLRNDNYGGKAFHRFKQFARNVDYQAKRTGMRLELVVVEWNPPTERQSIARELELSKLKSIPSINIITVPHQYHSVLTHSERRDMYEFIAKNVGIRRAQGKWILTTNGDVILSDAAWDFMASNKMKDSSYYRVGLQNSGHILPKDIEPSKIAKTLHDDVSTIFGKHKTFEVDQSWSALQKAEEMMRFWNEEREYIADAEKSSEPYYAASGDFILMSKKNWHALRGFDEEAIHTYMHWDSQMLSKAAAHGLKEEVLLPPIETYHMWHYKNQWKQAYAGVTTNLGALQWQHNFMKEHGDACSFNQGNWGLNGARFSENHIVHGTHQSFLSRMATRIGRGIHELVDHNKTVPQCQHLIRAQQQELRKEGTENALQEKRSVLSVEAILSSFLVDSYAIDVSNTTLCQGDTQTITWMNATETDMWVGIWQADGEGQFLAWIEKHLIGAVVNGSVDFTLEDCASMNYIAFLNIGNYTESETMNDTMPVASVDFTVFELPDCVNATTPPVCPPWKPPVTPTVAPVAPVAPTVAPPAETPTLAPEGSSGLSSGAIAGIVIGALVGVLLIGALIAALYYFCIRRASYERVA